MTPTHKISMRRKILEKGESAQILATPLALQLQKHIKCREKSYV